jgi:hypothetical protein
MGPLQFVLFLDKHSDGSIDATEYTGFIPHPDKPDLTTLVYNKNMDKA